jgi:uncharacterized protein (TIGR02646 family)
VISIIRVDLNAELEARLKELSAQLQAEGANASRARTRWNSARSERSGVRAHLARMALGIERCMYCGDNIGSDIDHFEPISRAPLRTFDWFNHLLACGFCNNRKRSEYPCDETGKGLLIDPTSEDPSDHIRLILQTGRYRELTLRGKVTIDVFGLNRGDLVQGRYDAFMTRGAVLCYVQLLIAQNREDEGRQRLAAMREQPHASVLHAMMNVMDMDGAEEVLGGDVLKALKDTRIRNLLNIGSNLI